MYMDLYNTERCTGYCMESKDRVWYEVQMRLTPVRTKPPRQLRMPADLL
jgi:hypothetical protein